jgi:hypothetical protein
MEYPILNYLRCEETMPRNLDDAIRARATAFAHDIAAIVRESIAEQVMHAVGGGARAGRAAGRAVAKRGGGGGRRGKGADHAADEKVLAAIRSHKGGSTANELAAQVHMRGESLRYRLNKLRTAKKVRTTGKTSKMRYFAA